ncbi:MAG: hypothetical protein CVV44_10640 [Spirochaetae bacterium HGW-Spirochaetae-1]|jgi:hypothetical protein|nr:MAG: hypothetical protein CVV44_10640 [Spirochaetae bacterium HGW-Spirochaetae-1]
MNTAKQTLLDKRQEILEKKRLSKIIRDWADQNKKVFWRYEVACFYKSYKIKIANLPKPSIEDILISSHKGLLNAQQKTQLCNAIEKACAKAELLSTSFIDVKIDFVHEAVVAEVI